MRLVTFEDEPERHRVGAVVDGLVVDLNAACRALLEKHGERRAGELAAEAMPSEMLAFLGAGERAASIDPSKPDTLFEAERALLDDHRLIPLVYLPELYGLGPRVHNSEAAQKRDPFRLNLENLWVDP